MTSTKNVVAYILQGLGIAIIVINLFRALNMAQWVGGQAAFDIFLLGCVSGAVLLGFGELLKLMQGLFNQREPESAVKLPQATGVTRILQDQEEQPISESDKQLLTEFYTKQNMEFERLEATPYAGYVIVHRGDRRDIVDMNGFKPEILSEAEVRNHPQLKNL